MDHYRYFLNNCYDEDGTIFERILILHTFRVIKETDCGYWLEVLQHPILKKWVSKDSKKRYAYPTKKEALINYIKRTENCIFYTEHNLINRKKGLKIAEKLFKKEFNL